MRVAPKSKQRKKKASRMTWERFFQSSQGQAILRIVTTMLTVFLDRIIK